MDCFIYLFVCMLGLNEKRLVFCNRLVKIIANDILKQIMKIINCQPNVMKFCLSETVYS